MKHPIKAPTVGESVSEVSILKWARENGQAVKAGDILLEIESDKATVEVVAEQAGALTIDKKDGERIAVGSVIGFIDDAAQGTAGKVTPSAAPSLSAAKPATFAAPPASSQPLSPAVRKHVTEKGINPASVTGTGKGGRITTGDLLSAPPGGTAMGKKLAAPGYVDQPGDRRVPMSLLRQRIAERLVAAQRTAAILTTFNEVDMTAVMKLRTEHKEAFKTKHGVGLGFMSFFARAVVAALKVVPEVNALVDGTDTVYHDYVDLGVAVGTERGLVVPVVRGAHQMELADIEKAIAALALKARDGKLSIADMSGGTFTISNGGVYGSLLSTPILNPPQSGILGMHKIQERPIAVNGKVEIRPMMYLALSYDHRLIDGKGAVTFLVTLKDLLENPEKLNLKF